MRKRAATVIQSLAVATAIVSVVVALSTSGPSGTPYKSDAMPANAQLVLVTSFASGDTLSLRPLGGGPQLPPRGYIVARLAGTLAPAVGTPDECFGREALLHLIGLLEPGYVAWAVAEPRYADALNRWAVYLWTADGTFVNGDMITGGFAVLDHGDTPERFAVALSAAQARATSRRAGLLGRCLNVGAATSAL